MSTDSGIKVAIGDLIVYLFLAIIFMIAGDGSRALMFLAGSAIWIAAVFIWVRAKHDQENEHDTQGSSRADARRDGS